METVENFEELLEDYLPDLERGDIRKGQILRKDTEFTYLDIGAKGEGKVATEEVAEFEVDDVINILLLHDEEDQEGYFKISRRIYELSENWKKLKEIFESGKVVEGIVERKVNGGYIVSLLKYRCFLPGSHSLIKENESEEMIGQPVEIMIKDLKDGKRKKIIVSRKEVLAKQQTKELEELEEGQILDCKVNEILEFGLTVKFGNLTGFIHISEIAWKRIDNLKDYFKTGDEIRAKVIRINKEKNNVKLSIKQLKEDPWNSVEEKYPVKTETEGKIVRIEKFGAFAELEEGVEGLIHVSDLSWSKKLKNVKDFFKIGDIVKLKVIELNVENKKIKLGLKQLEENPWETLDEKYDIGKIYKGAIADIKDFGIFVNLEKEIDAFVHISDLDWISPSIKGFSSGDEVEIKILEINKENKKIKAGIKQTKPNPWDQVFEKYNVGDTIVRKIINVTDFGIFVEIEPGIDGMIHVSEASKDFIDKLADKFKVGDEIESEIINLERDSKKIKLSIKKIEQREEQKEKDDLIEKYGVKE